MSRSLAGRRALAVLIFVLAGSSATAQIQHKKSQRSNPTSLKADLPSYSPGTFAILSGASFVANETVTLQVARADGLPTTGPAHAPWTVLAGDGGRFVTSWLVCEDDCVGTTMLVTAYGHASGAHASTSLVNNHDCGTGVVTSVTPVGGSCSAFTPATGAGPDNYEVAEGGTYVMTIDGVTECTGDTITVFVQSSSSGNFCFDAIGGSGSYAGTFTMPSPACNTMPVSYKCGADAACTHPGSLGAQGPTSGCGGVHLRTSNFDGSCVRTGSDEDCSTPPASGSCCLVDGSCVEVTQQDCLALGGTYGGDGSTCVGVICPEPAGACCLVDGSCVQVTVDDCADLGGTYGGDGSLCKDATCPQPTGACCLVDGTCVEVTQEDCLAAGGTFNGDGSTCAGVSCPQAAGACCLVDGSCVQVTEDDCAALGGTFNGELTQCMDVSCPQPTGACCLVDGSCVQVVEADCLTLGGNYNGDGSMCGSVFCPDLLPDCYVLGFDTDDDGNSMPHGARVDAEFDCSGAVFPLAITGSVDFSGADTSAILNSTTGPSAQDPDLLVGKGNILILQTDANLTQCPPNSGVYCSHNDDENGGSLSFAFCVPAIPSSLVLVDIDGSDQTSFVVLTDVNGKTRTYTVPGNWTGDKVTNFPELGWKTLNLATLANQPGFSSTVTAGEQAGYDPSSVVQIDVHLGGSGGIDDLSWCE